MTPLNSAADQGQANPHRASSVNDFLREQGIFDETHAKAIERAQTEQIADTFAAR